MSGKSVTWRNDPKTLDRLEDEIRIRRTAPSEALARETALQRHGISYPTYRRDVQRIKELYRARMGDSYADLVAEVTQGLREVVHDADVESALNITATARALHQQNKIKALQALSELHGLAKPVTVPLTVDAVRRIVMIEDTAPLNMDAIDRLIEEAAAVEAQTRAVD